MKNLFLINEDERNRILNLHETATKNQYLTEQSDELTKSAKRIADKKYREKNKEKLYDSHKKWYSENKDRWNTYIKEYREKNVEKIRETKRNYEKTRKHNDPIYKKRWVIPPFFLHYLL